MTANTNARNRNEVERGKLAQLFHDMAGMFKPEPKPRLPVVPAPKARKHLKHGH